MIPRWSRAGVAAFPASKRPVVGPICLLSEAFCPNRPVIVIETESLVMPLGDGLLGQRPELPLQARTQPRQFLHAHAPLSMDRRPV